MASLAKLASLPLSEIEDLPEEIWRPLLNESRASPGTAREVCRLLAWIPGAVGDAEVLEMLMTENDPEVDYALVLTLPPSRRSGVVSRLVRQHPTYAVDLIERLLALNDPSPRPYLGIN